MLDVRADPLRAVIVLNGEPPAVERLREYARTTPVYAADGGAAVCRAAGVRPEFVAGDFDSSDETSFPADWELHHHPEQDRTDFQKVIGDLPPEVSDILVLGGLGARVDHQLSNLMIAASFPRNWRIRFEHGDEELLRLTPECSFQASLEGGSTLSLLPFPEAGGVTTEGLRWNVENSLMKIGGQLGQSNEVTGPVNVSLTQGCLYLWKTFTPENAEFSGVS